MRILDLDNCIANDAWRVPAIDWKAISIFNRYHRYHSLSPWDVTGNHDLFQVEEPVTIMTARPLLYREMTLEWLQRCGVNFRFLIMRNDGDHRPSVDLKRAQLRSLFVDYGVNVGQITCAYDDRPDVVQMYWAEGIRAEVRAIHSHTNYGPHGPAQV